MKEITVNRMIRSGIYNWLEIFDHAEEREDGTVAKVYRYQKDRVGELVAWIEKETNKVHIGWSLCHPIDKKLYHKEVGLEKAIENAVDSWDDMVRLITNDHEFSLYRFVKRCNSYYQNGLFPFWANTLVEEMTIALINEAIDEEEKGK